MRAVFGPQIYSLCHIYCSKQQIPKEKKSSKTEVWRHGGRVNDEDESQINCKEQINIGSLTLGTQSVL